MGGKSPKEAEQKMEQVLNAWRTLAAEKSFGGMTLKEFEAFVATSRAKRQLVADLNNQLAEAITARDQSDDVVEGKIKLVVAGVQADPDLGPNSALYQEMGYTREADRKPGLHRSKRKAPDTK